MHFFLAVAMIASLISNSTIGQIRTTVLDSSRAKVKLQTIFFTNRPLVHHDNGMVGFANKWNKSTNRLYFVMYHHEQDSFSLKFRAENQDGSFPLGLEDNHFNFFYKIYNDLRIKRGIKDFTIIVPGYSKTFKDQLYDFMHRLRINYSDSLQKYQAIITYAWGDEWRAYRYYAAKRSAKNGARDFAIFQAMLEEFLSDSVFFKSNPKDFTLNLVCMSMGNQLLKQYLLMREKESVPLMKTYNHIDFVGSDASWDSFEDGKGFHHIHQFGDSVSVLINTHDKPLWLSQKMNFKARMGQAGPKNMDELPGYINVYDISDKLEWDDLKGLDHDYFLRNDFLREEILRNYFSSLEIE